MKINIANLLIYLHLNILAVVTFVRTQMGAQFLK